VIILHGSVRVLVVVGMLVHGVVVRGKRIVQKRTPPGFSPCPPGPLAATLSIIFWSHSDVEENSLCTNMFSILDLAVSSHITLLLFALQTSWPRRGCTTCLSSPPPTPPHAYVFVLCRKQISEGPADVHAFELKLATSF
jgi:hypothetical protein